MLKLNYLKLTVQAWVYWCSEHISTVWERGTIKVPPKKGEEQKKVLNSSPQEGSTIVSRGSTKRTQWKEMNQIFLSNTVRPLVCSPSKSYFSSYTKEEETLVSGRSPHSRVILPFSKSPIASHESSQDLHSSQQFTTLHACYSILTTTF